MNSIAKLLPAMALSASLMIYPQNSMADGFSGATFAAWSQVSQDSYIQSSVLMAGVIGSQVKPEISRCIDVWYFETEAIKAERNEMIRDTIAGFADHHPSGVILALIQRACGSFK